LAEILAAIQDKNEKRAGVLRICPSWADKKGRIIEQRRNQH